jgi:hypothetical protein
LRQGRRTGHTHVIAKVQVRRIGFGLQRERSGRRASRKAGLREKINNIRAVFGERLVAIGVEILLVAWYLFRVVKARCADRV